MAKIKSRFVRSIIQQQACEVEIEVPDFIANCELATHEALRAYSRLNEKFTWENIGEAKPSQINFNSIDPNTGEDYE